MYVKCLSNDVNLLCLMCKSTISCTLIVSTLELSSDTVIFMYIWIWSNKLSPFPFVFLQERPNCTSMTSAQPLLLHCYLFSPLCWTGYILRNVVPPQLFCRDGKCYYIQATVLSLFIDRVSMHVKHLLCVVCLFKTLFK